jgi:hypothetical protein
MKSALAMSWVVARKPAVLMTAPLPISTPFGLIRKTRPLALSVPKICDGFGSPMTRLSTVEVEFGWMNRVVSPEPMLNDCQLMTAFWVLWVTVTVEVPVPSIEAEPPTTCPPCGLAKAGAARTAGSQSRPAAGLWGRRCMALVPHRRYEEEAPGVAGTFKRLRRRQIDIEVVAPPEPDPAAGRGSRARFGGCPHSADCKTIKLPEVGEAVKLQVW